MVKPTLLITGASGFIGSELTKTLAPDYNLLGLSRFKRPPNPLIQWFQADISKPEELKKTFLKMTEKGRIEGIIHLAAHIDLLDRPSEKWQSVNVHGTENLLREAVRHHIPFFVYASSIVVMDSPRTVTFLDESARRKARLRYPASKMRAEEAVEGFRDKLKVVILRIASVYSRKPQLSYLNYQIASLFNRDLSTRFLPTPLTGGMAYVNIEDTARAFQNLIERQGEIQSGEIFVISEEGYLPHSVVFEKIQQALSKTDLAIFPIPIWLAKWGTCLKHLWDRIIHPRVHLRPWMAEFATIPFCVDIRKAKKELQWSPHHHITLHLKQIGRDLLAHPDKWFEERNLHLKAAWMRRIKKGLLWFWDRFLCRLLLDTIKITKAYLPLRVRTLVSEREEKGVLLNLHRIDLPCRIPWRFLLKVVVKSWPTSLVHFVETRRGYDYRLLGRWSALHFNKVEEETRTFLQYRVTSGFAAGGYQTFSMRRDGDTGQYCIEIDTRVPRGKFFPVRIHNFYTAEHLQNIVRNLFSFRLRRGESLL